MGKGGLFLKIKEKKDTQILKHILVVRLFLGPLKGPPKTPPRRHKQQPQNQHVYVFVCVRFFSSLLTALRRVGVGRPDTIRCRASVSFVRGVDSRAGGARSDRLLPQDLPACTLLDLPCYNII